jgi:hypothetical protein
LNLDREIRTTDFTACHIDDDVGKAKVVFSSRAVVCCCRFRPLLAWSANGQVIVILRSRLNRSASSNFTVSSTNEPGYG